MFPHTKREPKDILMLPMYVGATFWIALAKIYALVTIRDQKWIRPPPPKVRIWTKIKNVMITAQIMTLFMLLVVVFCLSS